MKVLLISREYPFGKNARLGGGGSHVFYLGYALAEAGVEVRVLASAGASHVQSPAARLTSFQVSSAQLGRNDEVLTAEGIASTLKVIHEFNPDVIHGHHLAGSFLALAASAASGIPCVITMQSPPRLGGVHGASRPHYQRDPFYARWRVLATDDRIARHIAHSKTYFDEYSDVGAPADRVPVVDHGVPIALLLAKRKRRAMPDRWGIRREHKVVVCPLRPEKRGVSTFIDAAEILQSDPELASVTFRFVVTGKTPTRPELSNVVRKVRAQARSGPGTIVFDDFTLRQMWELLGRADICVLPSPREGFSVVALEAMALHTPIVASEIKGLSELIADEETGLLFEPENPVSLASQIKRLVVGVDLASRLAENAHARVQCHYDASQMAVDHLKMYQAVVLGHRDDLASTDRDLQ